MQTNSSFILFTFCFTICSAFSAAEEEPEKMSEKDISISSEAFPSTFVGNVNTIHGNFLLPTTDLYGSGPNSLPFVRYYNSSNPREGRLYGVGITNNYPSWIQGLPLSDLACERIAHEQERHPPSHHKEEAIEKEQKECPFLYALAEEDAGSVEFFLDEESPERYSWEETFYLRKRELNK